MNHKSNCIYKNEDCPICRNEQQEKSAYEHLKCKPDQCLCSPIISSEEALVDQVIAGIIANTNPSQNPVEILKYLKDILPKKFSEYKANLWEQVKEMETKVKSIGKDELYCEFWKCLICGNSDIPAGSKFCSECGRLIVNPE